MKKNLSRMGLPVGFLVLILLLLIPTPPELSTAGHRMLAILVFSVIIWMTEAVAYPVSAGIIMSLMGSGFNGQSFAFNGYLPIHPADRAKRIKQLEARSASEKQTQLFIETPYRNAKMVADLLATLSPHCA